MLLSYGYILYKQRMVITSPQYGSSDANYWEKRIGANAGTYEDFVEGNDNLTISSFVVSSLSAAIEMHDVKQIEDLLSRGANAYFLWHDSQLFCYNAMSFSIRNCSVEVVRALLEQGVSPNRAVPSRKQRYPIHPLEYALRRRRSDCCICLLEHGATIRDIKTFFTKELDDVCVLEQLEKSGAVFDRPTCRLANDSQWGAVYLRCMRGARATSCRVRESIPSSLLRGWRTVELLILEAWDQIVPLWLVRMKHIRLQSDEEYDFSSFYKKRNCYNAVMGVMMCCLHRKNHEVWRFIHPQIFLSMARRVWATRNDKGWKL